MGELRCHTTNMEKESDRTAAILLRLDLPNNSRDIALSIVR